MRCTIDDFAKVDSILRHPSIYPFISDDYSPSSEMFTVENLLKLPDWVFLTPDDNSIFMYVPVNGVTWEVHSNILPESRSKSTILAKATLDYMFNKTRCLKITTCVPEFNQKALYLCFSCGLKFEGCSRKSFMWHGTLYDQYLLGIVKEEFLCQR